jgi:16S rRNA (cytidine1402-2'-O)-methyltransferase
MLYIVSTPIGNLKDISFRAIETLKNCDRILAEDTRTSQVLFKTFEIETPMMSFHQFNERKRKRAILHDLRAGKHIALISDAGTPGICDPGADLIRACRCEAIPMQVIPGPCALIAALSLYGIKGAFQFIGFLEKKERALKKQLIDMLYYQGTSVAYVSPHNLLKILTLIPDEREIFLARELTKLHEEMLNGSPNKLLDHFQKRKIQGEFVLIMPGFKEEFELEPRILMEKLQETFGIDSKEAMVIAARLLNRPKREIYDDLHRSCPES